MRVSKKLSKAQKIKIAEARVRQAKRALREALLAGPTGSYRVPTKGGTSFVNSSYSQFNESPRSRRRHLKESAPVGFVPVDVISDDDIFAATLPAGSAFSGDSIVWSISSRGMWVAAAVIVRDLDEEALLGCNPFSSPEELREGDPEEGISFDCIAKLENAEGSDSSEPVVFKISEGEYFIDYYDYDTDEATTGVYFGEDVDSFLEEKFGGSENDWDEDDEADWDE